MDDLKDEYKFSICPRCNNAMEWLAQDSRYPDTIEYKCDHCFWQGDIDHLTGNIRQFSQEHIEMTLEYIANIADMLDT